MSSPQMTEPGALAPAVLAESPLLDSVGYLIAKTHARMHERGNELLAPLSAAERAVLRDMLQRVLLSPGA
jgi:hypothetical protein